MYKTVYEFLNNTDICFDRKTMLMLGTAPTASIFVDFPPNCAVAVRRGLTAPKSVKSRTGHAKETGSVTSTGADVTNVEKRTSTGRSSPFQAKDLESEPKNLFLLA